MWGKTLVPQGEAPGFKLPPDCGLLRLGNGETVLTFPSCLDGFFFSCVPDVLQLLSQPLRFIAEGILPYVAVDSE